MDLNLTLNEWQTCSKQADEMIRCCSTIHVIDGMNSMTIGMGPKMWTIPDADLCAPSHPTTERPNLLYTNLAVTTDTGIAKPRGTSRKEICATLDRNGFPVAGKVLPVTYWNNLRNSVFVASPEGNGVDCHRTYEALWAGAIPIVQTAHKEHIQSVYGNVPLLWTTDYSEITPDYLRAQLPRFLSVDDAKYDFSRLYLSRLRGGERHLCNVRTRVWKDVTNSGRNMPNQWPMHLNHFKVRVMNSVVPQKRTESKK